MSQRAHKAVLVFVGVRDEDIELDVPGRIIVDGHEWNLYLCHRAQSGFRRVSISRYLRQAESGAEFRRLPAHGIQLRCGLRGATCAVAGTPSWRSEHSYPHYVHAP